jgi:hypothetical protein
MTRNVRNIQSLIYLNYANSKLIVCQCIFLKITVHFLSSVIQQVNTDFNLYSILLNVASCLLNSAYL